jgi:hypothetical protein
MPQIDSIVSNGRGEAPKIINIRSGRSETFRTSGGKATVSSLRPDQIFINRAQIVVHRRY